MVSRNLGLTLAKNSERGHDAQKDGVKYEIKGRHLTASNPSTQLGAIRDFKAFDFLVAVLFNADFSINVAVLMPSQVARRYAKATLHTNSYRLLLQGAVLDDPEVTDIRRQLRETN